MVIILQRLLSRSSSRTEVRGQTEKKGRKVRKDPLFPEFSWTDASVLGYKLSTAATFAQRGALKQELCAAGANTCAETGRMKAESWAREVGRRLRD